MQYNESLNSIANLSFPYNHLLTIGMVQRITAPNVTDYKEKLIFFVSLIPGENQQGQNSNRTYNFQNAMRQKYSIKEILALSFALRESSKGIFGILPFQKFTTDKQSSVWLGEDVQNNQKKPCLMFTMGSSQNKQSKITIKLPFCDANAIGEILYQMGLKALQLEFQIQDEAPTQSTGGGSKKPEVSFGSNEQQSSPKPFGNKPQNQFNSSGSGNQFGQNDFGNQFEQTIMNGSSFEEKPF
jgi:hypothetical protein